MPINLADLTPEKIAAMPAGPELDAMVLLVLGGKIVCIQGYQFAPLQTCLTGDPICGEISGEPIDGWLPKEFSTDANAAHEALERLGVDYKYCYYETSVRGNHHFVGIGLKKGYDGCWAPTFQHAAARAILAWWWAQQNKENEG